MRRSLRRRLAVHDAEAGMTLIELLVATAMSLAVVGGGTALVISAVRQQPELSQRAQNVSTARWQLERMTHEIRNGISVTESSPSLISFVARVRRTACGGSVPTSSSTPAIQCQIVYSCTTTACTRTERDVGATTGGTTTTLVTGIDSAGVFCFVPSAETDPTECGPAQPAASQTYVGITLNVPNPSGPSALTVSDGASLRTAALAG
jgi:Tfp pilus assembly protein PilW